MQMMTACPCVQCPTARYSYAAQHVKGWASVEDVRSSGVTEVTAVHQRVLFALARAVDWLGADRLRRRVALTVL